MLVEPFENGGRDLLAAQRVHVPVEERGQAVPRGGREEVLPVEAARDAVEDGGLTLVVSHGGHAGQEQLVLGAVHAVGKVPHRCPRIRT